MVGPSHLLSLHEFVEQIKSGIFPKQILVLVCLMDPCQKLLLSGVISAGTPSLHSAHHCGLHFLLLPPLSGCWMDVRLIQRDRKALAVTLIVQKMLLPDCFTP